jgi:hypothetical protein
LRLGGLIAVDPRTGEPRFGLDDVQAHMLVSAGVGPTCYRRVQSCDPDLDTPSATAAIRTIAKEALSASFSR